MAQRNRCRCSNGCTARVLTAGCIYARGHDPASKAALIARHKVVDGTHVQPRVLFLQHVVKLVGKRACWQWKGSRDNLGYGMFGFNGRTWRAHRLAWVLFNSSISPGLCILHKCDNPSCVNPKHLWMGTVGDNNRDRALKGRSKPRFGSLHGRAKLTEEQVLEIRSAYGKPGATSVDLAHAYGVSGTQILTIVHHKAWRHV